MVCTPQYFNHSVFPSPPPPHLSLLGGAGGKGTWGKITDVFGDEDSRTNDVCDPNYDSEDEEVRAGSLPPLHNDDKPFPFIRIHILCLRLLHK